VGGQFYERRKFGRRGAFKKAFVILENGDRIAGFVTDLADEGARFRPEHETDIQGPLLLEILQDDFIVKCSIIHRFENTLGLKFLSSPRRISWRPRFGSQNFPR
jgi:hypothetical protein